MANETGSGVSHVMLGVTDVERSTKFYEETLGRPVRFKTDGLVFIDAGSITIGLNRGLANLRQPVAGAMERPRVVPRPQGQGRLVRGRTPAGDRQGMGGDVRGPGRALPDTVRPGGGVIQGCEPASLQVCKPASLRGG